MDCRKQAELHVKAALADLDEGASEAERSARIAAALDYQKRVEAAIQTVRKLCDEGQKMPRASTTDAEARVMKMPDGSFRPAYNINLQLRVRSTGGLARS